MSLTNEIKNIWDKVPVTRIELAMIFQIGVAEGLFTWSDLTYFKSLSYSKHGRN